MFRDKISGKVDPTTFAASVLEETRIQGNPLPDRENPKKKKGQSHGQGSIDSPRGLSRLERSCE